jgi:hypothetical protein
VVFRRTRWQSAHLHLPRRSRHNARIPIVPRFRRASQQLYPLDLGVAEMLIDEEDVRGPNRLSKLGNNPYKDNGSCTPTSQWQSRVLSGNQGYSVGIIRCHQSGKSVAITPARQVAARESSRHVVP